MLISQLPHSLLQQNLPNTGTSSLTIYWMQASSTSSLGTSNEVPSISMDTRSAELNRYLAGRPCVRMRQTWNDSPQPHEPVEFGLLKRKPEPMMSST